MINLISAGERVQYTIWIEEDQAKDPRKRDTDLFHFPVSHKTPFILVCAGCAYQMVASYLEAFPVTVEVNRLCYSVSVLHYRIWKHNLRPAPVENLNIEKEGYSEAGFSAGGHLVASLGTTNYGYQRWNLTKPGTLLLGYPMTIWENMSRIHKHCRNTILGNRPLHAEIDEITILQHIDSKYPPTYIMH